MGNINFVSNNNNSAKKNSNGKDLPKDVEWTKPNSEPAVRNNFNPLAKIFGKEDSKKSINHQNIKKAEDTTKIVAEKTRGSSVQSFLKEAFRGAEAKDYGEIDKIKKNKKVLVDYQEIFNKEKRRRKENNNTPAMSSGEEEKDSKTIVDNIKSKSFLNYKKFQTKGNIKTNLIRNEVTTFVDWGKNLKLSFLSFFIVLLIISAAYGGLKYKEKTINNESDQVKNQIQELGQRIENLEKNINEKKIDVFQKKLEDAKLLLDKHIYWTNFFTFLENTTTKDVYYNAGFSGKNDGLYTISAQTDNFNDILNQVSVLNNNKKVIEAKVSGGKAIEDKNSGKSVINFNLVLNVTQDMFYK